MRMFRQRVEKIMKGESVFKLKKNEIVKDGKKI